MRGLRTVGLPFCLLLFSSLPHAYGQGGTTGNGPKMTRLAVDDWPPFVSPSLPGQGMSAALVSAVFERLGEPVRYDYFPWKRTMQIGLGSPRYAGLMPVWRTPEREKLCHFSAPIGTTHSVLAYLRDDAVAAASVAELKGMRIGTVAGYSNGEQFDAMVARHELAAEEGLNDITNLKKLLIGRYRAIVIERHVLQHLLMSSSFSRAERDRIGVLDKLFAERSVHICFQRNAEGARQQRRFNEVAREVDTVKLARDYWKRLDQSLAGTPPSTP